jgi:hypothetical protein
LAQAGKSMAQPGKPWPRGSTSLRSMNCRITSYSSGEALDTVEMHVDTMIVFYPGAKRRRSIIGPGERRSFCLAG